MLTGGAALEPQNYIACERKTMKYRTERWNNLDLRVGARSKCIVLQGSMLNFCFQLLVAFFFKVDIFWCAETHGIKYREQGFGCVVVLQNPLCVFLVTPVLRVEG